MADVVSELDGRLSGRAAVELTKKPNESPADRMDRSAVLHDSRPPDFKRAAIAAIVLFWTVQFIFFSLDRLFRSPTVEPSPNFAARSSNFNRLSSLPAFLLVAAKDLADLLVA